MSDKRITYLEVSSGDPARARELVSLRYPGSQLVELSHRELRDKGWKGQIKSFRALKGLAVVFYFDSFADSKQLELIPWLGILHGCGETAIVDRLGTWRVYRRRDWAWMLPKTFLGLLADGIVFLFWLGYLKLCLLRRPQKAKSSSGDHAVAYLFPFPLVAVLAGGAASHIRGFLSGLAANRAICRIFSGIPLPTESYPVELIPNRRTFSVFWESAMLSYNFSFARSVRHELRQQRPALLYQRHGRFSVAGAVLSRQLSIPLVLEYNGSEVWMSEYWDPARFRTWLRLCEEVALKAASLVVVVSEPLKEELLARGIPAERVLVNPNGVDPDFFYPGCGGAALRKNLGFEQKDIVVGFVGTFSHWHGVEVLRDAIRVILNRKQPVSLRFLLVGHGNLQPEMRNSLQDYEANRQVFFTGLVPHEEVRYYLDAADILVSPHVPMPDGRPFFGSPTKLFEYMAMGKGIVASNLDQLAKVLEHDVTGWMVEPGGVAQLADGIQHLAGDDQLRTRLGRSAREVAVNNHSWRHNSYLVLRNSQLCANASVASSLTAVAEHGSGPERSTA